MKPNIEIVTAGAGSGKTYRLASEVLDAIRSGESRPEGILLTTFTRKAAAELEERVRVRLLEQGAWEDAQRIRRAWIGTIDSVCLQLIQDYAFEAGQSPELAVFSAGEERVEFNRALTDSVTDAELEELAALSYRLSIENTFIDRDWRSVVKEIADATRSNRIDPAELDAFARQSTDRYMALLRAPLEEAASLDAALRHELDRAINTLNQALETGLDKTGKSKDALQKMRRIKGRWSDFRPVSWVDWVTLSKIDVAKKSKPLVQSLVEAAGRHPEHPRLHDDIRTFTELVFSIAGKSLLCYQERKSAAGLLDFTDLEEICLQLMDNEAVAASLEERLDLVLVDEFQDTSPIQLALFLKLANLAKRSVWVGDQKQSIFEFRGADPMLMQSVLDNIGNTDRLEKSYRSRPGLVELVNKTFEPVFPRQGITADIRLEADRNETLETSACESWVLGTRKIEDDIKCIARRVGEILGAPESYPVVDRRSLRERPIRAGDICVLARRNDACTKLADAMSASGVAVELARPGLIQCPEVLLTLAGLRLLLNPTDSMAAAQLTFLNNASEGDLESWLLPRLEEVAELDAARAAGDDRVDYPGWSGDPTLSEVQARQHDFGSLSPLEILHEAISLSGVRERCVTWGEPSQRFANLEKLAALTEEYQDLVQTRGEASSIAGLLTHLYRIASQGDDEQALGGAAAVRVSTYHRAKGLEWHMVVLYQLDEEPRNWLYEPTVESPSEFSFEQPLRGRWIRYWPWPYGNNRNGVHLDGVVPNTAEYQTSLRRAENEQIRLLYVGMTRARDYLVFATRSGKQKWLDQLRNEQNIRTFELPQTGSSADSSFNVLALKETEPLEEQEKTVTWLAEAAAKNSRAPKVIYCSNLTVPGAVRENIEVTSERIFDRTPITGTPDMTMLGNAVHAFLGCDLVAASKEQRQRIAAELLNSYGVGDNITPADLVSLGERFNDFVRTRWPSAKLYREWPISVRFDGRELHGTADLVLETGEGYIIVDHKTFPGGEKELVDKARTFAAQLAAYKSALLGATGKPVAGTLIHFPVSGFLAEVKLDSVDRLLVQSMSQTENNGC